ncbi:MAG: hypothetical protein APR56_07420 [Methanosaeta sp. SDB]|nr:MAG: hypothetical protein APR56_07420 [Methanosaeta sp. SDB]
MKILSAFAISLILAALLAGTGCIERGPHEDVQTQTGGSKMISEAPTMEVTGVVTNVVDGDTFDVEGFGRVRLADVDSPEMDTPGGKAAKFFAETWLLGEKVQLDVDNLGGKDKYGRWVCVAYVEDPNNGSLINFNSMLVASCHAVVKDYKDNEFDPRGWGPASTSR